MAVLAKIPLNSEHPYWFDKEENKHCWWPFWEHHFGMVRVDEYGVFHPSDFLAEIKGRKGVESV